MYIFNKSVSNCKFQISLQKWKTWWKYSKTDVNIYQVDIATFIFPLISVLESNICNIFYKIGDNLLIVFGFLRYKFHTKQLDFKMSQMLTVVKK